MIGVLPSDRGLLKMIVLTHLLLIGVHLIPGMRLVVIRVERGEVLLGLGYHLSRPTSSLAIRQAE